MRAFQICNGLGSGNIGDDLMARAFWANVPQDLSIEAGLLPEAARLREPYPQQYDYVPVDWQGNECAATRLPGLLVGDTPVADAEGLQWPLSFLAPRLRHFHDHGLPVDAVGVGVEGCRTAEGKALFHDVFAPIRSWTVRSTSCRDELVELGVPADRIHIAADLAWLYRPRRDLGEWARARWREIGIDPMAPLLVVNVVRMIWGDRHQARRACAEALDRAASRGLQIAFFCNECRDGEFFDYAAAQEMAASLRRPASLLSNHYYSPDEALALLACATVTVGQRYHFILETVLAGSVPVAISRGRKIDGLAIELGLEVAGTVEKIDADRLDHMIADAVDRREVWLRHVGEAHRRLQARAAGNWKLVSRLPGYADCAGPWGAGIAVPAK
jgi:polysaccharide pyruvyl transferase WcaK-like protein